MLRRGSGRTSWKRDLAMNLTDQLGVTWGRDVRVSTRVAAVCWEWPWGVCGEDSRRPASAKPLSGPHLQRASGLPGLPPHSPRPASPPPPQTRPESLPSHPPISSSDSFLSATHLHRFLLPAHPLPPPSFSAHFLNKRPAFAVNASLPPTHSPKPTGSGVGWQMLLSLKSPLVTTYPVLKLRPNTPTGRCPCCPRAWSVTYAPHLAKVDPKCAVLSVTALWASPPCPSLRGHLLSRARTAPDPPSPHVVHDSSRPSVRLPRRQRLCGALYIHHCGPENCPTSQVTQLLCHRTVTFSLRSTGT